MITERIKYLIETKGITRYKFCKDLGFSNGFLDKPREISTDKYANILEYFPDVNPEWLLTGKGDMLREQTEQTESSSTQIDVTPSQMLEEIKALSVKIGHLEAENKMLREQVQNKRQYNPYPSVAESELKYR